MVTEFCRVYARVRPPAKSSEEVVSIEPPNTLQLRREDRQNVYDFDGVFPPDVQQEHIFTSTAKRIVDGCMEGFNGTIFAFGQTGSGKTFTMMGPPDGLENDKMRGLIPRVADEIFFGLDSRLEKDTFKCTVKCVFVELYNEVLYDLLSPQLETVTIGGDRSVTFKNASCETVSTATDLIRLVAQGLTNRHVGQTNMNRESSRSHAICVIDIEMEEDDGYIRKRTARLNLVDLAGSERQAHTGSSGDRLKEAGNINKSLLALSKVIRSLASGGGSHVGYRDSKLTHLLKDSLGGNSRTAVIVNLHPNIEFSAETQSTLNFAANCRKIRNQAKSNTEISGESVVALRQQLTICMERISTMETDFNLKLEQRLRSSTEECLKWQTRAVNFQQQNEMYQADLELHRLLLRDSKSGCATDGNLFANFKKSLMDRLNLGYSINDVDLDNLHLTIRELKSQIDELKCNKKDLEDQLMNELEKNSRTIDQSIMGSPLRAENRDNNLATPKEKKNRRRTMLAPASSLVKQQRHLFDDSDLLSQDSTETVGSAASDEMGHLKLSLLERDKALNEKERQIRDLQSHIDGITHSHQSQLQCKQREYQELSESDFKTRQELSEAKRRISILHTDITREGSASTEWEDRCKKESKERKQAMQEAAQLREKFLDMEDQLAQNNCAYDLLSEQVGLLRNQIVTLQEQVVEKYSIEEQYDKVASENLKLRTDFADKEAVVKDLNAEINRLSLARQKDVEEVRQKYLEENEKLTSQLKEFDSYKAELERKKQEIFDACEERVRSAEGIAAKLREHAQHLNFNAGLDAGRIEQLESQLAQRHSEADEKMQRKVEEYRSEFKRRDEITDIVTRAIENRDRDQVAKEANYSATIQQLEQQVSKLLSDKKDLTSTNNLLNKNLTLCKDERTSLTSQLQETFGHVNKAQKINRFEEMRNENFELKQRLMKLEAELTKSDRVLRKRDKP